MINCEAVFSLIPTPGVSGPGNSVKMVVLNGRSEERIWPTAFLPGVSLAEMADNILRTILPTKTQDILVEETIILPDGTVTVFFSLTNPDEPILLTEPYVPVDDQDILHVVPFVPNSSELASILSSLENARYDIPDNSAFSKNGPVVMVPWEPMICVQRPRK